MSDPTPDPHKLCLACGLCCKGGWFSTGDLGQDEVEPARSIGLRVEVTPEQVSLQLPCPKFLDGCCSIYDSWRPRVCGAFSCTLLDKFVAGEVGEKEAMRLVTAAAAMFDRIVAEVGDLPDGVVGRQFMSRLADDIQPRHAGSETALSPGAKMDVVALRVFYERHFRKTPQNGPAAPGVAPAPGTDGD